MKKFDIYLYIFFHKFLENSFSPLFFSFFRPKNTFYSMNLIFQTLFTNKKLMHTQIKIVYYASRRVISLGSKSKSVPANTLVFKTLRPHYLQYFLSSRTIRAEIWQKIFRLDLRSCQGKNSYYTAYLIAK